MGDQKLLTVDVLRQFGFVEDPKVQFSDLAPGHSFDFGNFELTAAFHLNLQFARVASFGGLIVGVNSLSQIDFEVPFLVESVEQCAAWIAWHLDGQGAASASAPWLEMGRQHFDTLPWVRRMAAYKARPHCYVERDWARVAFKKLREILATADDQARVSFRFDGTVLAIRCGRSIVPVQAEGVAWPSEFTLPAEALRKLPARLMQQRIGISVYEGSLTIGNRRYQLEPSRERPNNAP